MAIDLLDSSPQELTDKASLDELLVSVRLIEQWQDRHAQVLDYIYRHRLLRLIRTGASLDEVRTFQDHLARVNHPRRHAALNALDRPYAERWQVYEDLLETQIAVLRSDVPERILQRPHVTAILELVQSGRAQTQQAIQAQLGLKEANASRILKLMEQVELIVRRKAGRENRLLPGPSLERVTLPELNTSQTADAPTEQSKTTRGSSATKSNLPRFNQYLIAA